MDILEFITFRGLLLGVILGLSVSFMFGIIVLRVGCELGLWFLLTCGLVFGICLPGFCWITRVWVVDLSFGWGVFGVLGLSVFGFYVSGFVFSGFLVVGLGFEV